MAALIAHVRDPVVPPSKVRSDVPADLERIVLDCLAKEPVERPANVDAVERALAECACAGDWDKDRARQWWQAVGEETDAVTNRSDQPAGGS
jgi:serine/threonine-protein kinase